MGLVGPAFVAGTAALVFLLAAEVVAAMAAVSEAALIYVARHRNMLISLAMLVLEAGLAVALILVMRQFDLPVMWQATGPAIGLMLALGFAAVVKSRLLCSISGCARERLALAARLGRRCGGRCRLSCDLASGMGRTAVRHSRPSSSRSEPCSGPRASARRTASSSA